MNSKDKTNPDSARGKAGGCDCAEVASARWALARWNDALA